MDLHYAQQAEQAARQGLSLASLQFSLGGVLLSDRAQRRAGRARRHPHVDPRPRRAPQRHRPAVPGARRRLVEPPRPAAPAVGPAERGTAMTTIIEDPTMTRTRGLLLLTCAGGLAAAAALLVLRSGTSLAKAQAPAAEKAQTVSDLAVAQEPWHTRLKAYGQVRAVPRCRPVLTGVRHRRGDRLPVRATPCAPGPCCCGCAPTTIPPSWPSCRQKSACMPPRWRATRNSSARRPSAVPRWTWTPPTCAASRRRSPPKCRRSTRRSCARHSTAGWGCGRSIWASTSVPARPW